MWPGDTAGHVCSSCLQSREGSDEDLRIQSVGPNNNNPLSAWRRRSITHQRSAVQLESVPHLEAAPQNSAWTPLTSTALFSSSSEGMCPFKNLGEHFRRQRRAYCVNTATLEENQTCGSPVKGALAVLKHILLPVFPEHAGSHGFKQAAVQQGLAHTHRLLP